LFCFSSAAAAVVFPISISAMPANGDGHLTEQIIELATGVKCEIAFAQQKLHEETYTFFFFFFISRLSSSSIIGQRLSVLAASVVQY